MADVKEQVLQILARLDAEERELLTQIIRTEQRHIHLRDFAGIREELLKIVEGQIK